MSADFNTDYYPPAPAKPKPAVNLKATLTRYVYHWPLFVLCILITVSCAYVYTLYLKPVYIINAKLLIKDNESKTKEEIALKELSQTQATTGVETEMQVLKSRPIIENIINRLQLWVTYERKGRYFEEDLYSISPVKFTLVGPGTVGLNNQTFDVVIENVDRFSIKKSDGTVQSFGFRDKLNDDFGSWKLDTTSHIKDFIGQTIRISLQNQNALVGTYQNKILATNQDKEVPVISLSIDDVVAQRGKDILNTLVEEYHLATTSEKSKAQKATLDFINSRLAVLSGELGTVEQNVETFKASRGINDVTSDSKAYFDNLQNNEEKLNDINLQLQIVGGIESYVNSDSYENPPVTVGVKDETLTTLVQQLSTFQAERNKLLSTTPETNTQIFGPINRQIQNTKSALKSYVAGIKANLMTIKRQMIATNSKVEGTLKSAPGQDRQLTSINRERSIKETQYIYLLQKKEEIGLDYASTIPVASTIEAANSNGVKSSQSSIVLAIGLILGFVIPGGILYSRDLLSGTIIGKDEITSITRAPVIAEIMHDPESTPDEILNRSRYVVGEQFRNLRTKLNYINQDLKRGKVTMFTSSIASEGKSFVASNLAIILAASGKKTIILELDMRLPKISLLLKANTNNPGLSGLLDDKATLAAVIQKTTIHPNLDIITAGPVPANPSELMDSENMKSLIEALQLKYDDILIDTPPIHLVTDAMILAPLVDTTLYVVRQTYTPKAELEFIANTYAEKKLPNMNIVFNGIQKMGKYSYGYKHDYTYYTKIDKKGVSFKEFLKRF